MQCCLKNIAAPPQASSEVYGGAVRFMNGSGLARRGKIQKERCAGASPVRDGAEQPGLPERSAGVPGGVVPDFFLSSLFVVEISNCFG